MKDRYDLKPADIVYEDDWIIVVNKPAGLPSQATLDPERDHCYASTLRYLQAKSPNAYAGLHHRLDALTSGALLMTKDVSVNASISEQFQTHSIEKTYCAICIGSQEVDECYRDIGAEFLINAAIGELQGGKVTRYGVDGKKRKPARTRISCEGIVGLRDGLAGLYLCHPETGRTHQIRVHLASIGMTIVGDPLYGVPLLRSLRCISPERMCLHAEAITFEHPVTHERMTVRAERPKAMNLFWDKALRLGNVR